MKSAPVQHPIYVQCKLFQNGAITPFSQPFAIGRSAECEVRLQDDRVSRIHVRLSFESGVWIARDQNSRNGMYHKEKRVEKVEITSEETLQLGHEGPEITFTVTRNEVTAGKSTGKNTEEPEDTELVSRYADRYFREGKPGEPMGEHTMYVRRAFAEVKAEQARSHRRQRTVLAALIAVLLLAGGVTAIYAYRLHQQTGHQKDIAENLFYTMKALDVEIANAERIALAADHQHGEETVQRYESRREQMQQNYDQFLATLHTYDPRTSEQHRLILRVARIFGECELDMPPGFEQEVNRYINLWRSSGRYARDISLARQKGYTRSIAQALTQSGLPPQFFYLAMQESDFNPGISGPLTRKGFAKGMWQFIPETAAKYGLRTGPLVDSPAPDPEDERDQAEKATEAATKYLNMLYSTDAQASGLLVMACYNWGENSVLPLVRSMPHNPRQRNFWQLLLQHRDQIPQQTYDYVFMITAAAVIGENPRAFGFDFDNPLATDQR